MPSSKIDAMMFTVLIGMVSAGCIAEDGSVQDEYAMRAEEEVEAVEEAAQALDTCTTTGGGTWGNIITLCRTSNNSLYVKKRDGGAFTSSGTMKLKTWLGTIDTRPVYVGQKEVWFGPPGPGWYSALYESNAPGTAYTGEIQVQ
ncbi:hypothetical protein [Polyangium jinanense]|uniref:Lipoprotein n=1 Tax=Polyangium jinanense TaxID=2829994 RepID=A0A9X3X5V5_9BACT|nr:hypothetical protein [Polyangium jinanense]MDC3956729.1 hypothetical protein [Polyangium jinanense]MDC3984792.1 hypothetical protein [Polyangium jinanense]